MKRLWSGMLAFVTVVGFVGSSTLAMVLSLTTPTAAKVLVFAAGFFGTLLVGAVIPGVRREIFGVFFQPVPALPEHAATPERRRNSAVEHVPNQQYPKRTPRSEQNMSLQNAYKYLRADAQKLKSKED